MRTPYDISPAAWDSKRIYQTRAEYANPFHGHSGEPVMSTPAKAIVWCIGVLFGVLFAAHFFARG